ncbi:DNA cytosine methyltransferase [Exilibacterium tricleocarpae]|uniref:DNA (cytosine-5-)-methyltransferase n=1 Tax=Exilibacterium tricleocarpae TaxID=2591008 RepID=A0A545U6W8_9GAMM|nr:DNA cytosine methyltransferase [Exilibacterium tricleocarpae]TQV85215.1 DNA cytosine methyltransferase [Exilibacterium tricleocarpae]
MNKMEIRHFHLFCGIGGGAAGFNRGQARINGLEGKFRCLGGIDVDPNAIKDFNTVSGVPGAVLDLFDRQQYIDWHGQEPPSDWQEATPDDIRRAAGNERPHMVFTSPPCKGFSGLLSQRVSATKRYQALNRLTVRGLWLTLEAWRDDPPEFVLLENVPRIATRGGPLLDQLEAMLSHYGYTVARTTHDCGELGGLAQSRRRFLLVARHAEKVPPFLYEPVTRPLRGVGEVIGKLPVPGTPGAGAMHQLPSLQWKTWVRLAFVEAGSDWRSLRRLAIENGYLRDYLITPERYGHRGALGVVGWDETAGTVTGQSRPANGRFSVADPRYPGGHEYGQYGVRTWSETCGAVSGQSAPGGGRYAIADPRLSGVRHNNVYRIIPWDRHSAAVTAGGGPSAGGLAVADPRPHIPGKPFPKYRVTPFAQPAHTVIAGSGKGEGAFAVADPRTGIDRHQGDHYLTANHYGVLPWDAPSGSVTASAKHDNGQWSVADPRELPAPTDNLVTMIRALDNTWHRPFTTLELAALQGLVDTDNDLTLCGNSHSAWRERIGNMVPPPAAQAIASVMGTTLLLAWSGETFVLGSTPIWVRPLAIAATIKNNPPQDTL